MNKIIKTLKLPGSIETRQTHVFNLHSGLSTPAGDLENGGFQLKHAQELYKFLFSLLPAGIYRKFVLLILEGDIGCNNYIATRLNIPKKEMKLKHNGVLHD